MPLNLPEPIAAYFTADPVGAEEAAGCFAENAVVIDEQKTYVGREAIRNWRAETATKFSYVSQPFAIDRDGDKTIVTSRVTGDFPGSPVDLRYHFHLDGASISRLEIVP